MSIYSHHVSTKVTPQSMPIPSMNKTDWRITISCPGSAGKAMVPNSAGGFVFKIDDWARLDRFILLGCEGGSYYATEKKLTVENAEVVQRCIAADPARTVARIVEISEKGRAPKNDPANSSHSSAAAA